MEFVIVGIGVVVIVLLAKIGQANADAKSRTVTDDTKKLDAVVVDPSSGGGELPKADIVIPKDDTPDPKQFVPIGPQQPAPSAPDPLHPSPIPAEGQYYQVVQGDVGDRMCSVAYGLPLGDGKPQQLWFNLVVPAPENAWIAYSHVKGWTGGLVAHYSGWNTEFDSGHEYPVIYFPKRST